MNKIKNAIKKFIVSLGIVAITICFSIPYKIVNVYAQPTYLTADIELIISNLATYINAFLISSGQITSSIPLKEIITKYLMTFLAVGIYTEKQYRDSVNGFEKTNENNTNSLDFSAITDIAKNVVSSFKNEYALQPNTTNNIIENNSVNWITPDKLNIDGLKFQYLGSQQWGVTPFEDNTIMTNVIRYDTNVNKYKVSNSYSTYTYMNIGYGKITGNYENLEFEINRLPLQNQRIKITFYNLDDTNTSDKVNDFLLNGITGNKVLHPTLYGDLVNNSLTNTYPTIYFNHESTSLKNSITLTENTNGYFYLIENYILNSNAYYQPQTIYKNSLDTMTGIIMNNYTGTYQQYDSTLDANVTLNAQYKTSAAILENGVNYQTSVTKVWLNNNVIANQDITEFNVILKDLYDALFNYNAKATYSGTYTDYTDLLNDISNSYDTGVNATMEYYDKITGELEQINNSVKQLSILDALTGVSSDYADTYETATEQKEILDDAIEIQQNYTDSFNNQILQLPSLDISNEKLVNSFRYIRQVHEALIEDTDLGGILTTILLIGLAVYILGRRSG